MELQPSMINPGLDALGVFIGDWEIEISSVRDNPSARIHGSASFQWLEGGAFLLQHTQIPGSPFPATTAVIGPDDAAGTFGMLYFDSRGVSRIYQMSLSEGVWKLWRDFPEFSQRFTATFSEDHNILNGSWEMSTDGLSWEHDFDIKFTKIGKP